MSDDSTAARVVSLVGGSHFVHHTYFMLLPPIFVPLSTELDLTDPQLGLALGTLGFVVTALQLPFGHVSDSRSRTLVLGLSFAFGAAGAALTAMAWDFPSLIASQVVLGVGIAGHHPAHYPLLSTATDPTTRGRAYSVHGFTGVLGFATPPAVIAAASALAIDWRVAIGAIAAVGAVYGVAAMVVLHHSVDRSITHPPVDADPSPTPSTGRLRRVSDALHDVLSSRPIVVLTILWFAGSMAGWGIKQYTGTLLTGAYELGPAAANLTVSAMLVTGAVLIFVGGWLTDRYSPGPVLLGGYAALVGVAGVLALAAVPVLVALALTLVLSATVDAGRPARAALADRFSSGADVGKNFGLLTIGMSGGAAVAPPILGFVVAEAGIGTAFFAIAGFGLVALALTVGVLAMAAGRDATPLGA